MKNKTAGRFDGAEHNVPVILHEDNHVVAVHKPAGVLTQGDASGAVSLLESLRDYLKHRDGKPGNVYLGMVQRLDKPVSGVIVFAKTSKGARRISEQIRNRQVSKFYVAVTPAAGADYAFPGQDGGSGWVELQDRLLRVGSKTVVCSNCREGSREAVLQMATVFGNSEFFVHLVRLITGRKHQIRAQLSARGMPVCGDGKYGSPSQLVQGRILLHAYLLRLIHPTKKTLVEISCPPDAGFLSVFTAGEQKKIVARLRALSSEQEPNGR